MAEKWEHGILSANSTSDELTFHTAGGATVSDGINPRQVLGVLDNLSVDGWEVVGPPQSMQEHGVIATSYFLRRQIVTKQPFQMPKRLN